jgi:capsular exopolysaccharide synthesis family protein
MEKSNTTTNMKRAGQSADMLSIIDMLMICLRHWLWFLLSLFIFLGGATLYLLSTPKVYTRKMSIKVKVSGDGGDTKLLEELGVRNLTSEMSDELVSIHSPNAVYEMVGRLHLEVNYMRKGFFQDETLYAGTQPVEVTFHDLKDNDKAAFDLTLNGDETVTLSEMYLQGQKIEGKLNVLLGKKSKTPFGALTITPSLGYRKGVKDEIIIRRRERIAVAGFYGAFITAVVQPRTKNIIDIACNDVCIPRADNILRTILNIYNENWVENRNQVSVSTNEFIKERLKVIEEELGDVEKNISDYKSSLAMPDVSAIGSQAMAQASASEQQTLQLSNRQYMVRYVRNYVSDPNRINQLLPASTGIGNGAIEAQIAEYNSKLLQRNNLVANSSEQNPLVQDLDIALTTLRSAIISSLDNEQMTINAQLKTIQSAYGQAVAKMSANPIQANHLLSIERQQKVKESLYLFLLQKREENELSQAFTAYNTRIIANPNGGGPSSPDSNRILMMSFAIAMLLPAAFFILREMMNTKVRGRKDLENMSVPYVGELPLWRPKKGEEPTDGYQIVVKQHKRDIVNEAFRVVRTNLEFMVDADKKCKMVLLTSFNPGSGKTFICANLGASYSIRGSRVLAIDLDMRRASLSEYVGAPKQGISDYLGGLVNDYKPLIGKQEESGLDILPVGKMPPNPTELLYSPKLKPMLDELRQQYDYIFIDCPPVEIVADATIMSREADITLFVVRAGLLERSMLPELEKSYTEKKYNNVAMILNGTDADHTYGYHRYGYGYGRYGYGYGYGKRHGYGYYGKKEK